MSAVVTATAPGKLVLFGEYAVLEGAPALVMAMGTRAKATFAPSPARAPRHWHVHATTLDARITLGADPVDASAPLQPLGGAAVPAALNLAVALVQDVYRQSGGALPPGTLALDTAAFYRDDQKLGLGSSGAITVAAWHALAQAAGLPPAGPQTTLMHLRGLHSSQQGGQGSGVDLAASLMGGVVRYQLNPSTAVHTEVVGPLSATHVRPLHELHVLPLWTGRAAFTGPFLQAFAALKEANPQLYWRVCEEMALISRAACELWALGEVTPLLPLVTRSMAALDNLGRAMGQDLITDVHRQAAATAKAYNVVYKPSGAGGGDFGLLFAMSSRSLHKASRALVAQGLIAMDTQQGGQGLSMHQQN